MSAQPSEVDNGQSRAITEAGLLIAARKFAKDSMWTTTVVQLCSKANGGKAS